MLSDFLSSKTVLVPVKIKNVLHSFEKNKTPAEDGFSKKFYETFFDHLKQNLLDSYNEAFQKGSLSVSQRRGVISLKNDCDLSELTGWRPITFFYFLPCINVVNLLSIKTYFTRVLQPRRRQRQRKRQFQNKFPFFQSSSCLFQFAENGNCRRISLELIS